MDNEPASVPEAAHPLHALATFELRGTGANSSKPWHGLPSQAPVPPSASGQTHAVLAEQESRFKITGRSV